jgi:glycosyltransferase involved in cell wall biosynthesis
MLPMYQFVMVGDIHSIERPPLNLQLLGRRNPNELPRIYSRAKVLVSTSKVEGFPSVLVEAATHGVPYVGFLDPDHVVRDYGIGEKASDLSEMAKILNKLMNEEDIRIKLGTNARRFVQEHRDIERTVRGWIRLFEELTYGRR